jgi:hypothetical protein
MAHDARASKMLRLKWLFEIGAGHREYRSRENAVLDVKLQSGLQMESNAPNEGPSVRWGTSKEHFIKSHPSLLSDSLRHIDPSSLRPQYSGLVFIRIYASARPY